MTLDEYIKDEQDERTAKDKLRDAFKKNAFINGHNTPEELYAFMLTVIVTRRLQPEDESNLKPDKFDQTTLGALTLMGKTLGYLTESREYIIQSGIPKLDIRSITRA